MCVCVTLYVQVMHLPKPLLLLSFFPPSLCQSQLIEPIGCFMAYVHGTVNQISKIYLQNEKRYNYTTPKTFLEYIFLYRKLLVDRSGEHTRRIQRLQSGMAKLAECASQVDTLKVSGMSGAVESNRGWVGLSVGMNNQGRSHKYFGNL